MRRSSGLSVVHLAAAAAAANLVVVPGPASAATVMAVSTKAVEIKIEVDDALKATPALFDNLAAEGTKWADKHRRDTERDWKQHPDYFPNGNPFAFERRYTPVSTAGRYVGVLRTEYTFTGGAHPNTVVDTILWDGTAGKRISVRPFFAETADNGPTMTALAGLIRTAVATEKKARGGDVAADPSQDEWLKAIEPSLLKLGPLVPAPSTEPGKSGGLEVHFSPYAVGSYAEGLYTVTIPWRDFERFLSPEGRALFGGEPVKAKTEE